jgi:hypothetical protein
MEAAQGVDDDVVVELLGRARAHVKETRTTQ